ncbi:MAG TPA: lysylphosphatidylglycerol synthase transmembrane domain-containing protein [Candidatus Krumholzibacteria bacterium]|nr:lysylphosphatidylglycerol synthase transmembrane domain-containing protein [Candidatus Krumholzibacteria bacterium]
MPPTPPPIHVGRIKTGLKLFLAFSVIGFIIVFSRSSVGDTIRSLTHLDPRWLAAAVGLVVFDWLVSALRIYIFANRIHPAITYGACMRSCLANVFLGGATPSQSGGAAAQIYVLWAEGMTVLDATVACFLGGFLGTVIVLLGCAVSFSIFAQPDFLGSNLRVISGASLGLFALILVIVLFSLVFPGAFKRAVHGLLRSLPWARRKLESRHAVERLFDTVDRYHELMRRFMVRGKTLFAFGLVLSAIIYFNKFVIAFVILRGLGGTVDLVHVLYMQVVLLLIFYFSPSPGASGFAEVTTIAVMGSVIPKGSEAAFVLLWRFFTLVLNMMIGAGVLVSYLSGKRGRRRSRDDAQAA